MSASGPAGTVNGVSVVSRKLLAIASIIAAGVLATAVSAAPATSLAGKWVTTTPTGKIVLTLHKSGAVYKGTFVQKGKTYKVVAHGGNADGASQVMLTLTPGHTSTMCGLQGAKLFCSLPTGTATFTRA